jgi:hypothetical protein
LSIGPASGGFTAALFDCPLVGGWIEEINIILTFLIPEGAAHTSLFLCANFEGNAIGLGWGGLFV